MVPWSYHCAVIMPLLCHVPLWCHTAMMPLSHFVLWYHCATVVSLCHGHIIVLCPIVVPWCHHATTAPLLCHNHITVPWFLCAKASLCRDNATAVPLCHESAITVPCPVVVPQCHDAKATLCAMVSLCHDSAIAVPYTTAVSRCHCHTLCHGAMTVPHSVPRCHHCAIRCHRHHGHAAPSALHACTAAPPRVTPSPCRHPIPAERCAVAVLSPQMPHADAWQSHGLAEVANYCAESRDRNQWVPVVRLQER